MEKIKKYLNLKRRMRKQKIHYDPIMDESIKNNVIVLHKSRKIQENCSYPISEQYINSIKNYMNIVDKDFHIVIKHDPGLDAKHYGKYVTNVYHLDV